MGTLSMVLDSVKTLHISTWCFDLNMIIGLLRCFPCLENLYIEVMISSTLIYFTRTNRSAVLFFLDINCFQSSCLFRLKDMDKKV
jgi:hypothetical protein